jgi:hypothetical protein
MYSAMEQKKKDKKSVEVEAATHCRPFLSSPIYIILVTITLHSLSLYTLLSISAIDTPSPSPFQIS